MVTKPDGKTKNSEKLKIKKIMTLREKEKVFSRRGSPIENI